MKALLDSNGFDRRPHNLAPDAWYYEGRAGLDVYYRQQLVASIPWRSILASVRRYYLSKGIAESRGPA